MHKKLHLSSRRILGILFYTLCVKKKTVKKKKNLVWSDALKFNMELSNLRL